MISVKRNSHIEVTCDIVGCNNSRVEHLENLHLPEKVQVENAADFLRAYGWSPLPNGVCCPVCTKEMSR